MVVTSNMKVDINEEIIIDNEKVKISNLLIYKCLNFLRQL